MSWFTTLLGGGASNLIDSVGKVLDDVTTTKEEKLTLELEMKKAEQAYNIEMAKIEIEDKKLDNDNTDSARSIYNISKNISDKIANRIMNWNLPFLLIMVAVNIVCIKYFDSTLLAIISNVIGQVMQMLITERSTIINFYFGSSHGSSEKTKMMRNNNQNK